GLPSQTTLGNTTIAQVVGLKSGDAGQRTRLLQMKRKRLGTLRFAYPTTSIRAMLCLPRRLDLLADVECVVERGIDDIEDTPCARHANRVALFQSVAAVARMERRGWARKAFDAARQHRSRTIADFSVIAAHRPAASALARRRM